jgi:hypothetical protein
MAEATRLPRSGVNIANVSCGDHLEWGAGSARLGTPKDFARSVERWVTRDGAGRIHFREQEYYRRHGRTLRPRPRDQIFIERPGFDENAVEVHVMPGLDHLQAFSRTDLVMPLVLGFLRPLGL